MSTTIKDVGSVMNLAGNLPTPRPTAKDRDASFQDVWNNQNGARSEASTAQPSGKAETAPTRDVREDRPVDKADATAKPDGQVTAEDSGKTAGTDGEPIRESEAVTVSDVAEEEPVDEETISILFTAAIQLVDQVAQEFGVTPEEVVKAMDSAGLSPLELFDPDRMNSLLLELGEAEDNTALLTDEVLYRQFRNVTQELGQTLEQTAAELGIPTEELQDRIRQAVAETEADVKLPKADGTQEQESLPVAETKPEITVTTEREVRTEPIRETADAESEEAVASPERQQTDVPVREDAADDGERDRDDHPDSRSKGAVSEDRHTRTVRNENPFAPAEELREFAEAVSEAETSQMRPDTQNIMRQIMDYMRINLRPGMDSIEMQLHPASMGTLHINIASKGGVMTAQFIAQNEAVKDMLETQMVQLRESFEQQGVKVEAVEVTVWSHAFEEHPEEDQGRQYGSESRRGRNRRFRAEELSDFGNVAELTPEERLAAALRNAGGNADHTA